MHAALTQIGYLPDPNYNRTDRLNVTATDQTGRNTSKSLPIEITPVQVGCAALRDHLAETPSHTGPAHAAGRPPVLQPRRSERTRRSC